MTHPSEMPQGRRKPPADVVVTPPDKRLLTKVGGMIAPLPAASRMTLEYRIEALAGRFLPEYIEQAAALRDLSRQPKAEIEAVFDLAHNMHGFGVNAGQRASGALCKCLCDLVEAHKPVAPPRELVALLGEAIYSATQASADEADAAADACIALVRRSMANRA